MEYNDEKERIKKLQETKGRNLRACRGVVCKGRDHRLRQAYNMLKGIYILFSTF